MYIYDAESKFSTRQPGCHATSPFDKKWASSNSPASASLAGPRARALKFSIKGSCASSGLWSGFAGFVKTRFSEQAGYVVEVANHG